MENENQIAIVGGGLAGLIASILLVRKNFQVVLIEKKIYPFHRVCGEYISNETVPFLKRENLFPHELNPSQITRLQLTSVNGKSALTSLDSGGFGVSRYSFDHWLYTKAKAEGVQFLLGKEVASIDFKDNSFTVNADLLSLRATVVVGAFGKRSKIDYALHRQFLTKRSPYVGVKYHVRTPHPPDLIALHNFKEGYCGISHVEDGITNLCYLTHRSNLRAYKSIDQMEEAVLFRNPFLRNIFTHAEFLFAKPEVINEITFATKAPVENHVLMAGDSAGMITPLCGNGMAQAIHAAALVAEAITNYFTKGVSRDAMEKFYAKAWNEQFSQRLWTGRQLQKLFGSETMSNIAVELANRAPSVAKFLISKTHGKPF